MWENGRLAKWVVANRHAWSLACASMGLFDRRILGAAGYCNCYGGGTLGWQCSLTGNGSEDWHAGVLKGSNTSRECRMSGEPVVFPAEQRRRLNGGSSGESHCSAIGETGCVVRKASSNG